MSSSKVLRNFSHLGIVQILNYALPLITIPLVSRALGVDKIGLISYIFSYITYFILLVNYSFSLTAIRKQTQINDLNLTFSLVFKSQFILLAISSVIFFTILFLVPDLRDHYLLAYISYVAVLAAFFDKNWIYQYKQDLSIVAIVNVILKLLGVVFIILFIKEQGDYLVYAAILYGVTALTNIVLFLISLRKYQIKFVKIKFQHVFDFLKEGKMLFFSSVVISLYSSTSTLLLGLYFNNRDVGLYTSATKLIEIAKVFAIMPITQLIYPIVAHKISENVDLGVSFVKQLMPIFNLMATILFIGTLIIGPFALHILFGSQFLDAIPILWILSISLALILYSTVFGVLLMVNLGLDHLFFKNQLYVAIISVLLTILILPYGAGMTSAVILVFSEILITGYQYYCFKDAFKALKSH